MNLKLKVYAFSMFFLVLLSLTACGQSEIVATPVFIPVVLGTPVIINDAQNLEATQAQVQSDASNHAAETAVIVRANAQATLDAANATLGAVQTQNQNNADVIAAQIAATAQVARAAAFATVNSAESTQSAAETQDTIQQTQQASRLTSDAVVLLNEQNRLESANGTQTVVANQIATQTQSALATTQVYTDQARQRDAQGPGPLIFVWIVCLPVFLVILAILALWGLWRWLHMRQDNHLALEKTPDELPPVVEVVDHRHAAALLHVERNILDVPSPLDEPDDQMQGWLDEVKDQLKSDEKKAEDDQPDH